MSEDDEIWTTLHQHIQSIFDGDVEAYCATTAEDLSLFEWWVTPLTPTEAAKLDAQALLKSDDTQLTHGIKVLEGILANKPGATP